MNSKHDRLIELLKELKTLLPFETDNLGQIIIYTGMKYDDAENFVPFTEEDENCT